MTSEEIDKPGKPPLVHFLRCPECSFVSIDLKRFDRHMPCCLREKPPKYFTYVCDKCQAMCTSRDVMEEHRQIYHKDVNVNIIECCDTIKNCHLPSLGAPPAPAASRELLKCSLCTFTCVGSEELVQHVQLLHNRLLPPGLVLPPPPSHTLPQNWPTGFWNGAANAAENLESPQKTVKVEPPAQGQQKQGLQQVAAAVAAAAAVANIQAQVHTCAVCGAVFRNAKHLENHMSNLHPIAAQVSQNTLAGANGNRSTVAPAPQSGNRPESASSDGSTVVDSSLCLPLMSPLRVKQEVPDPDDTTKQASSSSANVNMQNGLVHNTMRKTKSDMKVIRRFFHHQGGETREPHLMSAQELDSLMQEFVMSARKKDGNDYEPESLKAFVHSLERYLKVNGYQSSVLRDPVFAGCRTAMQTRLLELRAVARAVGTMPGGRGKMFGAEHTARLVRTGVLGHNSPQSLLNTLWYFNRVHFNIRGSHKHRALTWGQLRLVSPAEAGAAGAQLVEGAAEYLQFCPNLAEEKRFYIPSGTAGELPLDAVDVFQVYSNMRPMEARSPSDPFYLLPDPAYEQGGAWFRPSGAGVHMLASIPKKLGIRTPGPNNNNKPSPGGGGDDFLEEMEEEVEEEVEEETETPVDMSIH